MPSRATCTKALLLAFLVFSAAGLGRCSDDHDDHAHHEEEHADHHAEEDHAEEHGHSHGLSPSDYCAALAAGEDPCAASELSSYDLPLHIASVFILLGVSLAGSLGPLALHRLSRPRCPAAGPGRAAAVATVAIRLGAYFGFGTMLATALIHMMLPAVAALQSPCLPPAWTQRYEAWAYLFVLLAVLLMHLVDYLIKGYYARRCAASAAGQAHAHAHGHTCGAATAGALLTADLQSPCKAAAAGATHAEAAGERDAEGATANDEEGTCPVHGGGCSTLLKPPQRASQVVGVYLAEAGIIFHSVMIGLTLGVTGGDAFVTLLAALSLHQLFEGLAIGSAAVDSGLSAAKCAVMGLAYSVTTPVGIAVGIAIRESFNANAQSTLLVTGTFDALSAGTLLYVSLVQLLTPQLTDSEWLRGSGAGMQVAAFAFFYGGAAVMAAIGKWA